MSKDDVTIKIKVDSGKAEKALKQSGITGERAAKKIEVGFKSSTSAIKVMQGVLGANVISSGFNLASRAAGSFFGVLGQSIDLAQIQEVAVNDLNVALQGLGQYSEAASKDLQKFASELQQSSIYGDEAILKVMALGTQMSGLAGNDLKKATQAATNMASALNVDLDTAMRLIAKSATDGGSGLKRYGIEVEKGSTASETLANAIEAVNRKFTGAAAGKLNTYGGSVTSATNAWGDMLEELGKVIIKNPIVIKAISNLKGVIEDLTKKIIANQGEIAAWLEGPLKRVAGMLDTLGEAIKHINRDSLEKFITNMSGALESVKEFGYLMGFAAVLTIISKIATGVVAIGGAASYLGGKLTFVTNFLNKFAASLADLAIGGLPKVSDALTRGLGTISRYSVALAQLGQIFTRVSVFVGALWSTNLNKGEDALVEHMRAMQGAKTPLEEYTLAQSKANDEVLKSIGLHDILAKAQGIDTNPTQPLPGLGTTTPDVSAEEANRLAKLAKEKALKDDLKAMEIQHQAEMSDLALVNHELELEQADIRNMNIFTVDENYISKRDQIEQDALQRKHTNKKGEVIDEKKFLADKFKLEKTQIKRTYAQEQAASKQLASLHQARNSAILGGVVSLGAQIVSQTGASAKEQFVITQGLMMGQALVSAYAAANMALATPPGPPATIPLAAATLSNGLINAGLIGAMTAVKLGSSNNFAQGGFAGGFVPGSSFTKDKINVNVNSGEAILNTSQQRHFMDLANGSSADNGDVASAINNLASRPIVVEIDGHAIASSVRDQVSDGFVLA